MAKYYNWYQASISIFWLDNKIYLDTLDIYISYSSIRIYTNT